VASASTVVVILGGGETVTAAELDFVGSATDVAVIVTLSFAETVGGAL
jgi:hypothetical protein